MARSLPLAVVTVAVLVLAVLVPAPLVLSRGPQRLPPTSYKGHTESLKNILRNIYKGAKRAIEDFEGPKTDGKLENPGDTAGLFVFNLSVGASSRQDISGILDISSELVWTQCAPCTACLPAPTFQPKSSARLPCGSNVCQQVLNPTCGGNVTGDYCPYIALYGDYANTTGYLATDTFWFGNTSVPGFVFGCSGNTVGDFYGASGVFGFSRGPLSLVSQLQLSWFSYFFASDESDTGSFLKFSDDNATLTHSKSRSSSTPLLTSRLYPDLYFVNLTGISVGNEVLRNIPAGTFDFRANGSGGVYLSTTVPVTFLEEAAYNAVKQAFMDKMMPAQPVNRSAQGHELCYTKESISNAKVPELALVFDGAEAMLRLERSNYFFPDDSTGLDCLTILPSRDGSLLGSMLQMGRKMTYDIDNKQLVFETVAAAAPRDHPLASLVMVLQLAVWVLLL